MFDVGQKVICVRKGGWKLPISKRSTPGPDFLSEWTIAETGHWFPTNQDWVSLAEWPGKPGRGPGRENWFDAKCFRPKEPNIESLRSLITELPARQAEEV
jgi:hypothetical protein